MAPRRKRSFAREIEERTAACGSMEAARDAVVDDLAAQRLRYRGTWLEGILFLGVGYEYRAARRPPACAWNYWAMARDGDIDGYRVEFRDDGAVISGPVGLADITVWDPSETTADKVVLGQQQTPAKHPGGAPETYDWEKIHRYVLAIAVGPNAFPKTVEALHRRVERAMDADEEPAPGIWVFRDHYRDFYHWAKRLNLFGAYRQWAKAHDVLR
jgi:hypothetical protein